MAIIVIAVFLLWRLFFLGFAVWRLIRSRKEKKAEAIVFSEIFRIVLLLAGSVLYLAFFVYGISEEVLGAATFYLMTLLLAASDVGMAVETWKENEMRKEQDEREELIRKAACRLIAGKRSENGFPGLFRKLEEEWEKKNVLLTISCDREADFYMEMEDMRNLLSGMTKSAVKYREDFMGKSGEPFACRLRILQEKKALIVTLRIHAPVKKNAVPKWIEEDDLEKLIEKYHGSKNQGLEREVPFLEIYLFL